MAASPQVVTISQLLEEYRRMVEDRKKRSDAEFMKMMAILNEIKEIASRAH